MRVGLMCAVRPDPTQATQWGSALLLAHKRGGSGSDTSEGEDADITNVTVAKQIINHLTGSTDTAAVMYLLSRGVAGGTAPSGTDHRPFSASALCGTCTLNRYNTISVNAEPAGMPHPAGNLRLVLSFTWERRTHCHRYART